MSELRRPLRGFALLPPEQRKKLARFGGKRAWFLGKAHRWNSEEAQVAGRTGGLAIAEKEGHMSMIGAKGGAAGRGRRHQRVAK